jgi:pimeloyl-ACP methyl ester carboxylesterase
MFPYEVSKDYNALFIYLEHRYYGASHPFDNLSTENLRYLTSRQALADIAEFLTAVNEELIDTYGGSKRKVVVVGGSYPGALAAWFKAKYPHIADVAWASSAVVNAIKNFTMFDYQIYNSTMRTNSYCMGTLQNMTIVFDRFVDYKDKEKVDEIKGF